MSYYRRVLILAFLGSLISLEASLRRSSAPFISGDTFRSFCTYTCDEMGCTIYPKNVKYGDLIFVKVDNLPHFFYSIHPFIASSYVLVTHNGDLPIPSRFASFLNEKKLIAWFGQNVENYHHPKLHPIPIGLANQQWRHGDIEAIKNADEKKQDRDILLYVNINVGTNPLIRQPIYDLFVNKSYAFVANNIPFDLYLNNLGRSKFVLSPRGNGLDTHRTWEALYLGAIPIVKRSSMDAVFQGLPVLIVDSWEEISEEFLSEKYQEMKNKRYQKERLYSDYWLKKIRSSI